MASIQYYCVCWDCNLKPTTHRFLMHFLDWIKNFQKAHAKGSRDNCTVVYFLLIRVIHLKPIELISPLYPELYYKRITFNFMGTCVGFSFTQIFQTGSHAFFFMQGAQFGSLFNVHSTHISASAEKLFFLKNRFPFLFMTRG